jgi:phage terminase large subunit-like protein
MTEPKYMKTIEAINDLSKPIHPIGANRLIPRLAVQPLGGSAKSGSQVLQQYVDDILSGKIIAGKMVIKSCERHNHMKTQEDIYFDADTADDFFAFSKTLIVSDSHHLYGSPFILLPWQMFVVGSMLCWRWKQDHGVVFKSGFGELSRGQGKSALVALIGVYLALRWPKTEVVMLANKKEQANIALSSAMNFLTEQPSQSYETTQVYSELRIADNGSSIKAIASALKSMDGMRARWYTLDEGHTYRDDIFQKVVSALPKSRDSQSFSISTAGGVEDGGLESIYYQQRRVAVDCLDNFDKLRTIFSYLANIDDDDDIADETCWIKSSPSLNHIISLQDYKRAFEGYQSTGRLADWERYHCCRFSKLSTSWIEDAILDEVECDLNIEDFFGKPAFIGVDLSKSMDISSVAVMVWDNGIPHLFCEHWVPTRRTKYRSHAAKIEDWRKIPNINIVDTKTIDYDSIGEYLLYIMKNFKVKDESVGIDALGGVKFITQGWEQDLKIPIIGIPQTITMLGPALITLETLIREQQIKIRRDPCLRHCINSVGLIEGVNGDRRPCKNTSSGQIDPVIATLQALIVAIEHGAMKKPSYQTADQINI